MIEQRGSEVGGPARAARSTVAGIKIAGAVLAAAIVGTACGTATGEEARSVAASYSCGGDEAPGAVATDAGPAVEPVRGGQLVYGVEAESDGFDPFANRWAISGLLASGAIYDTLTRPTADGEFVPHLAESIEANEDFTRWEISVRDGVRFHNGEVLDAEALQLNLEEHRSSPLTSGALEAILRVSVVDDRTVVVDLDRPWATLPQLLASQVGTIAAPEYILSEDRDHPIGTGPFEFDEWVPDSHLSVVANDAYWQEGLPYLDGIEFRPIPDNVSREAALLSGDIDLLHTYTAETIDSFRRSRADGGVQAWESCDWGEDEEFLILLNNGAPPFDDRRMREAFARAVDREEVLDTVFGGTFSPAYGPFPPSSPWYEPTDPERVAELHDPERARELVDEYEAENGDVSITLGVPAGVIESLRSMQLTQQYLEAVGIDTDIETFEQTRYITNALSGDYQAQVWRHHGAADPDGEYVWWHPDSVRPIGEISLNMARFEDEVIGKALDRARATNDPDTRREAYAEIQQRFRDEFYLLWSAHAFWMVAAAPNVHDVVDWTTPDGNEGTPLVGGIHPLAQVWVE